MKTQITLTLALTLGCSWTVPAAAEYTLILKNGRRITVQSYQEDKGMIKFGGLGGEIGISKDQIQAIRKGNGTAPGDLDLTRREPSTSSEEATPGPEHSGLERRTTASEGERVNEEKEYQEKLKTLTERLETSRDRYSDAIRGTTSSDPTQLVTEEQINARQDDVVARFKDAQNNPSEPAPVKLLNPSPFTTLPPSVTEVQPTGRSLSPYEAPQTLTDKQQELNNIRIQTLEIEKERERLIEEMRQKKYDTGFILGQ